MAFVATLRTTAIAALALGLVAPAAAETVEIKAGVAAFNEALAPVYVAQDKGYFADAGVEVEMLNFKGGGATVQALVGGSIDACLCAADHILRLGSRGMPAQILVGLDEFHSYALLSKGDTPFDGLESLKGKRIAITSPGSLTDNTLRYMLEQAGMDPQSDVEIIATGGGQPMRAALQTDQVDAGMFITTDIVDMLREEGAFKVVEDFREMAYPSFSMFVLKSWIDDHPDAAKAVAVALRKAIEDLESDPDLARATIAKMYPNYPADLVEGVADSMVSRMPEGGLVSAESFDVLNSVLTAMDSTVSAVPLEAAFDPALMQ